MSENILENDFSSDDNFKDPDFQPSSSERKTTFIESELEQPVKQTLQTKCARCVSCHRVIRGSSEVTSNFIKHLQVKHIELFKKFKYYKTGSRNGDKAQSQTFGLQTTERFSGIHVIGLLIILNANR
ncbi:hypothetical protein DOY81_006082 [Sarcophaga bullata]|nr:hypothetical protein DOY81_006082 [Sarcophaga bullata]